MSVRLSGLARREYWLLAVLLTCTAFVWHGDAFAARLSQPAYLVGIFAWLFVAILGSALSVVRHADQFAVRLGFHPAMVRTQRCASALSVMSGKWRRSSTTAECDSAWKKDPLGGVIGVQKGPLC